MNAKNRIFRRLGRYFTSGDEATVSSVSEPALDDLDREIIRQVRAYTMTTDLRLEALLKAVRYVVARDIAGGFVECGVWLGGSVLAMLLQLQHLQIDDRDVYLFDTFEGMTAPSRSDTSPYEPPALDAWDKSRAANERPWGALFDRELFNETRVRDVLLATGYPAERVHLVKGPVEDTLPERAPERLALLRLDTDWYESTRHELTHLYPRLAHGGVLIIDDYGHWEGCRRAVDEFFSDGSVPPLLLQRVDYTCRIAVKS